MDFEATKEIVSDTPILLILDLDETLAPAAEAPLSREHDFKVGSYFVYQRPHLKEFLVACSACFRLAIWSTGTEAFVASVAERIRPPTVEFAFVWGRSRCVQRYDPEKFEYYHVKDLKKIRRLGYRLERVLIVDDTPLKVQRHFGNAVYMLPFHGDAKDDSLPRLTRYLISLHEVTNVRSLEKRGWSTNLF